MRFRFLSLTLCAALVGGCAHRFPVRTGGDREAVAGLPLSFGSPEVAVPEGTSVRWDFGDGSTADGPVVAHVWARAGTYRLKMEVADPTGSRSAEASVQVARRPPAAAVPPAANAAVIFDRFFARLPQHMAFAERLLGPDQVRSALTDIEAVFGLDVTRPELVLAAGLDPEEGLAIAWLPEDKGTWLAIGTHDERAALEAARSALAKREQVTFTPGPSGSTLAQVGAARLMFIARGGYLYVHLAGDEDAPPALETVLTASDLGLYADPTFAQLRAQVAGDDGFVFARASVLPDHEAIKGEAANLRSHTKALAVGFSNRESELLAQARVVFDAEGERSLATAFSHPARVDLEARAPAGAVGYLSLSLGAEALASWLRGGDHAELDRTLGEAAGLSLETIASLVSGGAAAAAWFDSTALLRSLSGDGDAAKLKLLSSLTLKDPPAARAKLDAAAQEGRLKPISEGRWETVSARDSAQAALVGDSAIFGDAGLLERALANEPGAKRLGEALRAGVPPEALAPGHQLLWLDIATLVDQLRNPKVPPGADALDAPQQAQLAMMVAAMVEAAPELRPLLPLRDAYLEAWQDGPALAVRARLRFR
ncbi:MAG: PKD domain-containing protein [Deltaproteobacteria bacterium]|nr:PKD domain-containing protein [Deltaproteobacteria bacterium]